MVKTKNKFFSFILIFIFLIIFFIPSSAATHEVYTVYGNVSAAASQLTSYLFPAYVGSSVYNPFNTYYFFRSDQYNYILLIKADNNLYYKFTYNGNSQNTSSPVAGPSEIHNISLQNPNNYLIVSNDDSYNPKVMSTTIEEYKFRHCITYLFFISFILIMFYLFRCKVNPYRKDGMKT